LVTYGCVATMPCRMLGSEGGREASKMVGASSGTAITRGESSVRVRMQVLSVREHSDRLLGVSGKPWLGKKGWEEQRPLLV